MRGDAALAEALQAEVVEEAGGTDGGDGGAYGGAAPRGHLAEHEREEVAREVAEAEAAVGRAVAADEHLSHPAVRLRKLPRFHLHGGGLCQCCSAEEDCHGIGWSRTTSNWPQGKLTALCSLNQYGSQAPTLLLRPLETVQTRPARQIHPARI